MSRKHAWVFWWGIVGLAGIVTLAWSRAPGPSESLGLRRFVTPPISETVTLSQTFRMTADGLDGVEVATADVGPVTGMVRIELSDVTDGVHFIHRAEAPAADLVRESWFRFDVPAIRDSRNRVYQIDLTGSPDRPPSGVALRGTKGERYPEGTMLINDRERWADLAFRTSTRSERSAWTMLMSVEVGRYVVSRGQFILLGLLAYWILLGVLLRTWWRAAVFPRPEL